MKFFTTLLVVLFSINSFATWLPHTGDSVTLTNKKLNYFQKVSVTAVDIEKNTVAISNKEGFLNGQTQTYNSAAPYSDFTEAAKFTFDQWKLTPICSDGVEILHTGAGDIETCRALNYWQSPDVPFFTVRVRQYVNDDLNNYSDLELTEMTIGK